MKDEAKESLDLRQQHFLAIVDEYKDVIAKVCSVYASETSPFADLYQEVMINLWTGLDTYKHQAKVSTWIYRIALNTCITWSRKAGRSKDVVVRLDNGFDIPDTDPDVAAQMAELYALIGRLEPFDKALITLWLDEKSYEEIAVILGITKQNVATRLYRTRQRLAELADK